MSRTVLCVEGDRNLCRILAKALGGEGYRVQTAFDGVEALAVLAEVPPDLVLLDVALSGHSGLDVLEKIRDLPEPRGGVPVVLITGNSRTPDFDRRAGVLGASDVLAKPVPLQRLFAAIAHHLRGAKDPIPSSVEARGDGKRRAEGLAGSLEKLPFAALLHYLHGLRIEGVLHLASVKKRKWIQFRDGYPVAVRGNLVNETLGNMLVRGGSVSPAAAAESRRQMGSGRLQGEILVAMDALTEQEMALALRAQAEQKLFEIFTWESGSFRFEIGALLQRANVLPVDESPANLILTGVRKRLPVVVLDAFFQNDGRAYVAPAESPFYRFQDAELGDDQLALLRRIDGTVRLSQFARASEPDRRTLYALIATGMLELRRGRPIKERTLRRRPAAVLDLDVTGSPFSSPRPHDENQRAELAARVERCRKQNHFEVLGVGTGAAEDEIHQAFSRLAEGAHPDRVVNASQTVKKLAAEVFSLVEQAHDVLMDPRQRTSYLLEISRLDREFAEREAAKKALDAEIQFQHGETALRQRSYDAALLCFGKALEQCPDEGEYHAHYGWALHLCHPRDAAITQEALEHVKRGIKLAGHREKPYLYMGRLLKALDRQDVAEKMFNRAVQIQPDCADALSELRLIEMRRRKAMGFIGRLFRR